jgi:hypothetical protein
VSVVVVAGVAITPLVADRTSDLPLQALGAPVIDQLVHDVRASKAVDAVDGPLLVLVNGDDRYIQVADTVGARLAVDGTPVVFPPSSIGFVHPDRLADVCTVQNALVLTLVRNEIVPPDGTEVARVDAAPTLDRGALARLKAQAADQPVVFGPDLDGAIAELPGDQAGLVGSSIGFRLPKRTEEVLLVRSNLDLLIDHPPQSPKLDRDDLVALRDSLPPGTESVAAREVTATLLDRAQLEAHRPDLTADC